MGVDRERGKGWILCWESAAKRQESDGGGMRLERFYTDFWQAYRAILPRCSHKDSKAERHGVERGNSLMRPYLARFCR